ncbi:MAG: protein kinase [Clostridia bacterium BRH_c25]|nr:MAG: protein kinase [Clostridia bacterium BRH_c25]
MYKRYIKNFDVNLLDCKLLGKGHNGIVYLLPEDKVIKICYKSKNCKKEYDILKRISKNKYFPRAYGMMGNYMIRDYVDGIPLNKHIKKHGLDKELAIKLMGLFEEFKKLGFKKQDIRCKDILFQPGGSLMVIDPKKFYSKKRNFPRHFSKGLYKLGVLDTFMDTVKAEKPKLYKQWYSQINDYISEKKIEYD